MQPREQTPQPNYATSFAAALLAPDRATPADVGAHFGKSATRRYDVYRNNVTVSLINALAEIFPAVLRLVGEDFFRAMARFYIRATPPSSPLLFEYGRDFPAFIEGYEHARSMPWLADVARVERAWLDAYHAADAEPLSPAALAAIPGGQLSDLVFTPHPATRIVRSQFAAVTIFAANRDAEPRHQIDASLSEDALVTRTDNEVIVRHLPAGGAVFATTLMSGHSLAAAAMAALDAALSFDIAANIAGLIEAGAFTTISFGARS
jgi:Putative DNA-binding domain